MKRNEESLQERIKNIAGYTLTIAAIFYAASLLEGELTTEECSRGVDGFEVSTNAADCKL